MKKVSVGESESIERLSSKSVGLFYIPSRSPSSMWAKEKTMKPCVHGFECVLLFTKEEVLVPHP